MKAFALRGALLSLFLAPTAMALTVTEPNGVNDQVVAAGDDYATQILGDPWDFSVISDMEFHESGNVTSQSAAGGIFSAVTLNNDPALYLVHQGIGGTVQLERSFRTPISTSKYRFATVKLRLTSNGGPVLAGAQPVQMFWFRDGFSIPQGTFGYSEFVFVPPNAWQIATFDLTDAEATSPHSWNEFAAVQGLRLDPTAMGSNVRVEIDWVRLTASPVRAEERFLVTWTDTVNGSYTVAALDSGGARHQLTSAAVNGTQFQADLSRLPPGMYTIEVSRAGAVATSPAPVLINAPPIARVTSPTIRGEQSASFAAVERGNPWGPLDPADVFGTGGLTNVRYDNPAGTLTGRPTNSDPAIVFAGDPGMIDATHYRSLCFTLQVFGPRDIGQGSVARLFWGNDLSTLATTKDIIVNEGLNEYCIEDLAAIPLESGATAWGGQLRFLRLDPHEFPPSAQCGSSPSPANCRDIRLDSVVLSPFASTTSTYAVRWLLDEPDNANAALEIRLDNDRNPSNGTGQLIATTSSPPGGGEAQVIASAVGAGTYYVAIVANDGLNAVTQYGGRLVVGAASPTLFANGFE